MKDTTKLIFNVLLAAAMLLLSYACQKDDDAAKNDPNNNGSTPVEEGFAKLGISLTASSHLKSTSTYNAVNVDIQQISFHTSDDTTVAAGWYDLETIPGIYNLMDFVTDDTLVAFDSLVATQTISQIRILLGDSNTVMIDSVEYPLMTPSAQTSGLKVQVHTQMEPDSTYVIMLDFDPEQSVKELGNGKYKLHPVIRTVINP
jgi:hypothetical protein